MDKKILTFSLVSITMSFICVLLAMEIFLRFFNIPGIKLSNSVYDSEVGLFKFKPNSNMIFTSINNKKIKRKVNSEGFLDQNHTVFKPNNTIRIGFFGDSYVEARQVQLEKTFFKLIEKKLSSLNVETLAFGISGFGTLHSYMLNKKYTEYFDLDIVVYVFVENDLGDHIQDIKKDNFLPYSQLTEDGFVINSDLMNENLKNRNRNNFSRLIRESFIYQNSVALRTIKTRFKMLKEHGVKIKADKSDFEMSSKVEFGRMPNQNDLPSSWDNDYKTNAIRNTELIISEWNDMINKMNKTFVILYVPRESEWEKADEYQDSWKIWLRNYCLREDIIFIDPSSQFKKYYREDKKIYEDHFTDYGHYVFSISFTDWFE